MFFLIIHDDCFEQEDLNFWGKYPTNLSSLIHFFYASLKNSLYLKDTYFACVTPTEDSKTKLE